MQGIYIVQLLNEKPMPVTQDKRYVNTCAKVSKLNVKVGKAKDFVKREKNYWKDFEQKNVVFTLLAEMDITQKSQNGTRPETAILRSLKQHQMQSPKGGELEWLENISASAIIKQVFKVLKNERFVYNMLCEL